MRALAPFATVEKPGGAPCMSLPGCIYRRGSVSDRRAGGRSRFPSDG